MTPLLSRRRTSSGRPTPASDASPDWESYLAAFHEQRAGITEEVLAHSHYHGVNAYQWLSQAVPTGAKVLDVACGSGPLHPLHGPEWVGVDASVAEMGRARALGRGPLVLGDATSCPFLDRSFDAVVCSMALMLIQPLEAALAEFARLVRPGGLLAVLLPSNHPLSSGDLLRYTRLLLALRRRLRYPNDRALGDPSAVLSGAGFTLTEDERRRFVCRVTTPEMAALCVTSLYLPGAPPERMAPAIEVAASWVGQSLGVPLRRLVARAP